MRRGLRAGRVVRCVASLLSVGAAAATPVPIAAWSDCPTVRLMLEAMAAGPVLDELTEMGVARAGSLTMGAAVVGALCAFESLD